MIAWRIATDTPDYESDDMSAVQEQHLREADRKPIEPEYKNHKCRVVNCGRKSVKNTTVYRL